MFSDFPVRIEKIALDPRRRVLVTSDIHGHPRALAAVLEKARFCDADELFIVGDILEKGPDSLGALRLVMTLCARGNAHASLGNVDVGQLNVFLERNAEDAMWFIVNRGSRARWGSCLLTEMCREAGIPCDTLADIQSAFPVLEARFAPELAFLRRLPTMMETDRFLFVHGGVPTDDTSKLDAPCAAPYLKNDAFYEKGLSFDKYVFVGHWPTMLYCDEVPCANPIIDKHRHIICMDGGCGLKADGQLNLVAVPGEQSEAFTFFCHDELPVVTAQDAQEESAHSYNIRWIDNRVAVTARNGGLCDITHCTTGYRMRVPEEVLYPEENGETRCRDVSDHRLAVTPGDALRVVYDTAYGRYCKKDGVTGWYFGGVQTASAPAAAGTARPK